MGGVRTPRLRATAISARDRLDRARAAAGAVRLQHPGGQKASNRGDRGQGLDHHDLLREIPQVRLTCGAWVLGTLQAEPKGVSQGLKGLLCRPRLCDGQPLEVAHGLHQFRLKDGQGAPLAARRLPSSRSVQEGGKT